MKVVINPKYVFLHDFIEKIPQLFMQGEGEVLHEGRNSVRAFELKDGTLRLAVKRYKPVNFVQQIAYTFFRKSKAERAYLFAKELRDRGFSTPYEVAYIEDRKCGLFKVGYFISLRCDDPPVFSTLVPVEDYNRQLAIDLSALFVQMHLKGVQHGDMNLGNFLYKKRKDGHYDFTIIDTNRSHFYDKELDKKQCLLNLRTVTTRRDLFVFLIRKYADIRHWNIQEVEQSAVGYLECFEWKKKKQMKWKERLRKNLCRKSYIFVG